MSLTGFVLEGDGPSDFLDLIELSQPNSYTIESTKHILDTFIFLERSINLLQKIN